MNLWRQALGLPDKKEPPTVERAARVEPDEHAVFQRSHPVAVCGVHAQRSPELAAQVTAGTVGDLVDLNRAGRVVKRRPSVARIGSTVDLIGATASTVKAPPASYRLSSNPRALAALRGASALASMRQWSLGWPRCRFSSISQLLATDRKSAPIASTKQCACGPSVRRDRVTSQAAYSARLPTQEVCMTTLKTGVWPWLIVAVVLILVGVVALDGGAGDIVLACGFIALFGAGIRLISRNDSTPPEERRVPAGHSGV